jgi:hypothetical protein
MLRNLLLSALLAISVPSSSLAQDSTRTAPSGPCEDPRYLELKKRPVDALSAEDFQYLKDKSKQCDEVLKLRMLAAPARATAAPSIAPLPQASRLAATSDSAATHPGAIPPAGRRTGLYLTASFGLGWTAQGDINTLIHAQEQVLRSAGVPVRWKTLGAGAEYSAELYYRLTSHAALALAGGHQTQKADNKVSDNSGSFQDSYTASIDEFVGTIMVWPFYSPDLSLGIGGGVGFGRLVEHFAFRDYADPANDLEAVGNWSGSGFVGAAFLDFTHPVGEIVNLHARMGYKHRNLGTFKGTTNGPQGSIPSTPEFPPGHRITVDYSGLNVEAGFTFRLGGPR